MLKTVHGQNDRKGQTAMQRVKGQARVSFHHDGHSTRLTDLYQNGSSKIRLPKVYDNVPVAVFLNTAGGITGGDDIRYQADVGSKTRSVMTSQTAERVYRRSEGIGHVAVQLSAANDATLEWLPQETILFDASALHRNLTVDLEGNAQFLAIESVILGRKAMGETVNTVSYRDRWRIRRNGTLIFADDIRLEGDPATILSGPAATNGQTAFATIIDCRPDIEEKLDLARQSLEPFLHKTFLRAAASVRKQVLIVRIVAHDGKILRDCLMSFLTSYRSKPLPRVWYC